MMDHLHPGTISMLSTYPPTACGIATFSFALGTALSDLGHEVRVVRVADGSLESDGGRRTAATLRNDSLPSVRRAAIALSEGDVAIIQHEFGIYGGRDGEEVLDVLHLTSIPLITVLHTVPAEPTPNQRRILERLGQMSSRLVVLTASARQRLVEGYEVDPWRVATIPHGAIVTNGSSRRPPSAVKDRPQLLTWGLIGPGKGIEHVIDAIASLREGGHDVHYTVAGRTHPKVARVHGERYRESLKERARKNGVSHLVDFDEAYRGPHHLASYIASSSVVVLPYDSTDQAVSGVLVDSIAAGRPVVSTAFPHARELLSGGAGILIPHRDQTALVDAIEAVTTDSSLVGAMTMAARRIGPLHSWSNVGRQYSGLADAMTSQLHRITA